MMTVELSSYNKSRQKAKAALEQPDGNKAKLELETFWFRLCKKLSPDQQHQILTESFVFEEEIQEGIVEKNVLYEMLGKGISMLERKRNIT